MKLCWLNIHKWTQWRSPRQNIQSRSCIHCNMYQRRLVVIECDLKEWIAEQDTEILTSDGIVMENNNE